MWHSLWINIVNTPGWIYSIILFLIFISFQSTRPIIIPVRHLLIMPVIFLTLSMTVILYAIQFNSLNLTAWLLAALLGIMLGKYQLRALKIKCIKYREEIYIPGSYSLLVITLLLVAMKLLINFEVKIDPKWIYNLHYQPYFMSVYGIITGMFAGRILLAYHIVNYGPFIDRKEIKS